MVLCCACCAAPGLGSKRLRAVGPPPRPSLVSLPPLDLLQQLALCHLPPPPAPPGQDSAPPAFSPEEAQLWAAQGSGIAPTLSAQVSLTV